MAEPGHHIGPQWQCGTKLGLLCKLYTYVHYWLTGSSSMWGETWAASVAVWCDVPSRVLFEILEYSNERLNPTDGKSRETGL